MPKVGMKKFSYDEAGINKANQEAMKTGLPIEYEDRHYAMGGLVSAAARSAKDLMKKDTKPSKGNAKGGRKATKGLQYKANK
mgnify:CR=1 FL=1|tara:strand:+ start:173 stop:418 length:246 start_codon:yes stop_codon:yes gene_type:complete